MSVPTIKSNHSSLSAHDARARTTRAVNVGEIERWASLIGGGALALYGLRRSLAGLALAIGGGALLYRGFTGRCAVYQSLGIDTTSQDMATDITVEAAATVNKPLTDVYRFYRTLENHPRFVAYLESVRTTGDRQSHWVAKIPLRKSIEWDAEIVEEQENALLVWRSQPGSDVDHTGRVRFRELPHKRGTEVHVKLEFRPPGGIVGAALAPLFNRITTSQLREDLRRFKQLIETGEIPTPAASPVNKQDAAATVRGA